MHVVYVHTGQTGVWLMCFRRWPAASAVQKQFVSAQFELFCSVGLSFSRPSYAHRIVPTTLETHRFALNFCSGMRGCLCVPCKLHISFLAALHSVCLLNFHILRCFMHVFVLHSLSHLVCTDNVRGSVPQ